MFNPFIDLTVVLLVECMLCKGTTVSSYLSGMSRGISAR